MTHYRNFRVNERISVRVPMMSNKGNYLAAADHELQCDVLQVGGGNFSADGQPAKPSTLKNEELYGLLSAKKYMVKRFRLNSNNLDWNRGYYHFTLD